MAFRLVQRGEGDRRPLVVLYLVGADADPDLRASLGPRPVIAGYDDPVGEPLGSTIARASAAVGVGISEVILAGFSAGCQAVRRELAAGHDPAGVLALDGTHADLPPQEAQLAPWRQYAERARACERLFIATCTQNTYVETDLPKNKRYSATVTVLRLLTGFALVPSTTPEGAHEGALHVYSYSSERTDAAAHGRQQRLVLPTMLRRHVRPWLEGKRPIAQSEKAMVNGAVALSLDRLARGLDTQRVEESPPQKAV